MKGMIFTGESIPAIWDGRKTQDRRVIKPQALGYVGDLLGQPQIYPVYEKGQFAECEPIRPLCLPGEIVYVKETVCMECAGDPCYKAHSKICGMGCGAKWRSPRFMPRAAARIFLLITAVRAEKLQDITEEDARAEGLQNYYGPNAPYMLGRVRFFDYWDSINARRGYPTESNPWVWVYEFERTEAPTNES